MRGASVINRLPAALASLLASLLLAAPAYAGDHSLTALRVEQCRKLAEQVGADIALYWAGWARAVLALSEGDPDTACAALAPFVLMFEEHGVPEPIAGFFLPDAIEAMISTAQLGRAERLLTICSRTERSNWCCRNPAAIRSIAGAGRRPFPRA